VSAGGDFQSLTLAPMLSYGPAGRTELDLTIPYLHNWASNVTDPAPTGQRSANFGGLGNISLEGKYLLVKEQPFIPAISAVCLVDFPTGHHRRLNPGDLGTDLLGRGAFTFTPGLNFYKYLAPFLLYGNLWYTMATAATVNKKRTYYPDRITVNFAAEYPLPAKNFVFLFEFVSTYDGGRLIGHRANEPARILMSVLPALEFIPNPKWSLAAGVLVDLFGKNSAFAYTPNVNIFYNF
ncbi:MAG TPA: transporter, partial [Desulfobaccales bacterium]|nr:transporter [Desulfobaccales bacterium]